MCKPFFSLHPSLLSAPLPSSPCRGLQGVLDEQFLAMQQQMAGSEDSDDSCHSVSHFVAEVVRLFIEETDKTVARLAAAV